MKWQVSVLENPSVALIFHHSTNGGINEVGKKWQKKGRNRIKDRQSIRTALEERKRNRIESTEASIQAGGEALPWAAGTLIASREDDQDRHPSPVWQTPPSQSQSCTI
jgi:hypothetical protein